MGSAEVDHGLPFFTLLEGNHDNAVGRLGTICGQGGGVLQDADGLDGVLVQVFQVTGIDDTVHHQQRSMAFRADGTAATDADGSVTAHVGGFRAHDHAGHAAAHHIGHIVQTQVGHRGVPAGLHYIHRSGEVLGARGTVSDDHNIVQNLVVQFQLDG